MLKILHSSFDGNQNNISLKNADFGGVTAVFITAHNDFATDSEILLTPEQPSCEAYVAIENHSAFWCRPTFGEKLADLPALVQALLIKSGDNYRYIMPVCDDVWKTVLRGSGGGMEFRIFTNCRGVKDCQNQLAWLEAEGSDPLQLAADCARVASEIHPSRPKLRSERRYPESLNYLGWCSWDALQIRVSEAGLLEKLREFNEKSVPVGFAIIDDMWADCPNLKTVKDTNTFAEMCDIMHESRLNAFSGDPERFANGMPAAIAKMKAAGVKYVGLWLPATGYWAGVIKGSPAEEMLRDELITVGDRILPNPNKAEGFFTKLCSAAKSWGTDFVKIDNQSCYFNYVDVMPVGEAAKGMQAGIDAATGRIFDGQLINCMGMSSECLYHRPDTAVNRCSDDFIPESKEWFTKNILQCSYNGILQGQFYVNDWDMFWTDDGQARKNSLCRAISGGPVYVSDKIGRTNADVLKPLCLADGRILRCDESATPTRDCIMTNPAESGKPFKIRNRIGKNAVLAAFNLKADQTAVSGTISAEDVDLTGDVVVYEYFAKKATLLKAGERMSFELRDADDFRLYWLVPYCGKPVILGRTDLFMGCGAVDGDGVLIEGGEIAVYSEVPVSVRADGRALNSAVSGNLVLADTADGRRLTVEVR